MPIPVILAGLGIALGASGHAEAKETNEKAQKLAKKAQELYDTSKEKLENYFCTLSDDDIRSMVNEQGVAVATCHFCNKKYVFTKDDLEKLIAEKNSKE